MKRKMLPVAPLLLLPALASAQQGEWELPVFWFGADQITGADAIRAIDLIHIFDGTTGKFLALSEDRPDPDPATCWAGYSRVWTPPAMGTPGPGVFEPVPFCTHVLFCGGHSAMADGRILHAGGGLSSPGAREEAEMFDPQVPPSGASWNNGRPPPDMNFKRWYPTCTTLADGTILVSGGTQAGIHVPQIERYHPNRTVSRFLSFPMFPFKGLTRLGAIW